MSPIFYIDCVRAQAYFLDYKSFTSMKNDIPTPKEKCDDEDFQEVDNYLRTEIDPAEHDLMLHQPKYKV